MTTLLHIDASARRQSISREVSAAFAQVWLAQHPDGDYLYRDLSTDPVPFIDEAWTELCDAVLAQGGTVISLSRTRPSSPQNWPTPGLIRRSRICVKTVNAHMRSPLKPLAGLARSSEMNWPVLILAPTKEASHG